MQFYWKLVDHIAGKYFLTFFVHLSDYWQLKRLVIFFKRQNWSRKFFCNSFRYIEFRVSERKGWNSSQFALWNVWNVLSPRFCLILHWIQNNCYLLMFSHSYLWTLTVDKFCILMLMSYLRLIWCIICSFLAHKIFTTLTPPSLLCYLYSTWLWKRLIHLQNQLIYVLGLPPHFQVFAM